jgi:hypothetical protein
MAALSEHFHSSGGMYVATAAPVAGNNEIQTLQVSGTVTAGTYRLKVNGEVTAAIAWNTTTAQLETALNNLKQIAAGGTSLTGVAVTGGPLSASTALTVTFVGTAVRQVAGQGLIELAYNNLTGGGTVVIARTQTAVSATHRGALPGALLVREDGTNSDLYQNTASLGAPPNWVAV